jgi:hypothetical protein
MRRPLVGVCVALFVAACAGGTGTIGDPIGGPSSSSSGGQGGGGSGSGGGSGGGGTQGTPDASANPPGCPASYGAGTGNCAIGLVCNYPQGRCECIDYCGGPAPPEGDNSHWECATKADNGCPDDPPTAGETCKVPTSCSYGACCKRLFTCVNGKWSGGGIVCPQ